MSDTIRLPLTQQQSAFSQSLLPRKAFSGPRACGKTTAGAVDLLMRARPDKRYAVFSPTYAMSEAATVRTFIAVAKQLRLFDPARYRKNTRTMELPNGAIVTFYSADSHAATPEMDAAGTWIDDPEGIKASIASRIIAQSPGWVTLTFTQQPKKYSEWSGRMESHWTDNVTEDWYRVKATLRDNVFISTDVIEQLERLPEAAGV